MAPSGTHFLLFVYGTLMRDGVRARHLEGQRFLGAARTVPRYALYDLGAYPGLVEENPGSAVAGELYEVETGLIALLDRVEGAPELYRLLPIELEGRNETVHAYVYQRDTAGHPRLAEGRWTSGLPCGQ